MITFRTPSGRFADLPGYGYEAAAVNVGPTEMAYVDVGSGHFLQEEAGEAVATHIVEFVDRTPT